MAFTDKLKKLREEHKLTQAELAQKLGVTQRTISYYETGKGIPNDLEMLNGLAKIFNVSLDYLLLDDEQSDSRYHALVRKLKYDTVEKVLKWEFFTNASFYKTTNAYNGENIYEPYLNHFDINNYSQREYSSIDTNKCFFAEYENGGYLVARINKSDGKITFALFAYYKENFHFIADMESISQIEELYFNIVDTQNEINEFIDQYLSDDLKKEEGTNYTLPDEEIPF